MTIEFSTEACSVSVHEFGARGDGRADDAEAIQRALESVRPVVVIPEGVYLLGNSLRVGSGKTILASQRAVLRLADHAGRHAGVFLMTNRDHERGNDHITVIGGIWDGNNEHNSRGTDGDPRAYTGVALNFVGVRHLYLADLTVKNPDSFSIRIGESRDFTVENITFDHSVIRPNQDGVHLGGFCENGYILNLRAVTPQTTNDDMVALNADDDVKRNLCLGMKMGPIRNIHVEGLSAESAWTFVRILSSGQTVENVRIRNISGGCRFYAINMNNWSFPIGSGDIRNVTIKDVRVRKASDGNQMPLVLVRLNVRNVVIEGFQRTANDRSDAPTLVLENHTQTAVEFESDSKEQIECVGQDSTSVTGLAQPLHLPGGWIRHRAKLLIGSRGRFMVASGGIERLVIEPQ